MWKSRPVRFYSLQEDQTSKKCDRSKTINGKQRYASRGLNGSVAHIAEQINSL